MFKSILNILWLAGLVFQAVLLVVLLGKRYSAKFPAFSSYVVFVLTTNSGLYLLRRFPAVYFYAYWVFEAIGILLGIWIVYEVFSGLVFPYANLHRLAKIAFRVAVVLLMIIACYVAYSQPSSPKILSSSVLVTEGAARILELGLLVFLFIFSTAFGLHWRQQIFGIALGLGLFVAVQLLIATALSRFGISPGRITALVRAGTFDISSLLWIGYLFIRERVIVTADMPKRAQLEQWNQAVAELINQ